MNLSETIFLFFLALIIFGPKKLPEIARQIGKYMNEFKRASNEFRSQIEQEIAHLEVEKPTVLPASPAPEGSMSRTLNSAPPEARSETVTAEVPATLAASEDEPLFASQNGAGSTDSVPATEAAAHPAETRPVETRPVEAQPVDAQPAQAHPNDVTSPSSQESHV